MTSLKRCKKCNNTHFKYHVITTSNNDNIKLSAVRVCTKCGTTFEDDSAGDYIVC